MGPDEPPGQTREQERDSELHRYEQERVVVGARVARGGDVTADVEPVNEAPPRELGDQREQSERQSGGDALMPPRTLHTRKVCRRGHVQFKPVRSSNRLLRDPPRPGS